MPNNSLSSIRSALATHLGAVTQLKAAVSGRNVEPTGFPFCRYYLAGISDQPYDNQPSNYRTYRFAIEIIQEASNKTTADSEADFQDAIDAVLDKLNTKWQLPDGSNAPGADDTKVEPSSVQPVQMAWGPSLLLTISFSVKTLIY